MHWTGTAAPVVSGKLQWGVLSHLRSLQAQRSLRWPLYNVRSVAAFGLMGNSRKGHVRMASQTQKIKGEDDNPSATLWLPLPRARIKTSRHCATLWCKHMQPDTKFFTQMTYIISTTKKIREVNKGTRGWICQARVPVCSKMWLITYLVTHQSFKKWLKRLLITLRLIMIDMSCRWLYQLEHHASLYISWMYCFLCTFYCIHKK